MAETLEQLLEFAKEHLEAMREIRISLDNKIHSYEDFLESHDVEVEKDARQL